MIDLGKLIFLRVELDKCFDLKLLYAGDFIGVFCGFLIPLNF